MARDASPTTKYLRDYQPPAFMIDKVDLYLNLKDKGTLVRSRLSVRRNAEALASDDLVLDGEDLQLVSIVLNGRPLSDDDYHVDSESLTVRSVPDAFELETEALIAPEKNTRLEGLYRSGEMFCSQCEAEGFRRITWYLDRPDVMARFTTTVEADKSRYPVLLSNGNPGKPRELSNGRHSLTWEDPFPKPAYLFAVVAGDLRFIEDQFTTVSDRQVALRVYTDAPDPEHCRHALKSLRNAMRWDEEKYGREYDLDIYNVVAVNDFNMGAMENKGLNIFNAKYILASPETATDEDYRQVEGVIGHEYFHNWTGNRITCRDWFQLSLKEGLTVFRDQEFSADMGASSVKRIQDVRFLRAHQFAEDAGPMAHAVRPDSYMEINNFYTLTVYEKGAEVVRMQHNLLGPETYRSAMDLYFHRHDGQAVTTDDFVRCMEDASGRDLTQFRRWYSQAGTPLVEATGDYDSVRGVFELRMRQSSPPTPGQLDKLPLHIPIAMGLLNPAGESVPLRLEKDAGDIDDADTRVLELTAVESIFRFVNVHEPPVPSLLRGFSAPIRLEYPWNSSELMLLIAKDSDGFARWDAAQRLHERVLLSRAKGESSTIDMDEYAQALKATLTGGNADPELVAELLQLPSESYLGDQMDVVDVDAIHDAREGLMSDLANALRTRLMNVYVENGGRGDAAEPWALDPLSIGRRRLKNQVLFYMGRINDKDALDLCVGQYKNATNMTDGLAALACVAHGPWPEREELLADFEYRWKQHPLVMDKWFALQATSVRPDTLVRVKQLMEHEAFHITNPNRVRALVGSFVNANPVRFHDASGEGYRFLTELVLELDGRNPQIAARLLRALSRWGRYDEHRQGLMRAELEVVQEYDGLSKDCYEIASKSLEGG